MAQRAKGRYRQLKRAVSRLAQTANRNVSELKKSGIDSPALQAYEEAGEIRFGVHGKNVLQVQMEYDRIKKFLSLETSSVDKAINQLQQIAENTGITYGSVEELKSNSRNFFQIASMVQQYMESAEGAAAALGYERIWQAINEEVARGKIDLSNALSVEESAQTVINSLEGLINVESGQEGFPVSESEYDWIDD